MRMGELMTVHQLEFKHLDVTSAWLSPRVFSGNQHQKMPTTWDDEDLKLELTEFPGTPRNGTPFWEASHTIPIPLP